MKIFLSTLFTLLTVVNSMVHEQIKVTEKEHNTAVIECPYTKGYEDYTKYFCRGIFKECRNIIKSDGKERWTFAGRFSLADDTERKKIVVNIPDLTMDDAGPYGCGIETIFQDPFTIVYLTVIEAPKPPNPPNPPKSPKPHQTTSTTARITTPTQAWTTHQSAVFTTDSTHSPKDIFIGVGAALGGVLLMLAVISGICYALRCKPGKNETGHVISEVENEDVRLYEEIQHTTPTQDNASISTNPKQCYSSHTGHNTAAAESDEDSNPGPACITIYSSITNPTPELHPEYTLATNPTPITDISSQSDPSSNEPNYSKIYFINDKALDSTVDCDDTTYSTVQNIL